MKLEWLSINSSEQREEQSEQNRAGEVTAAEKYKN